MKKWELVCSIDAVDIDYRTVIESENEPDFWYCESIANSHGYKWWAIEELKGIMVEDLLEEINQMEPAEFTEDDYFSNKPNLVWDVIQSIIDRVPNIYKDDLEWLDVEIATNGDELLFRYESHCERFADALDKHVFGFSECHTGYYDPYEDAISGETDENSGWYYLDWD